MCRDAQPEDTIVHTRFNGYVAAGLIAIMHIFVREFLRRLRLCAPQHQPQLGWKMSKVNDPADSIQYYVVLGEMWVWQMNIIIETIINTWMTKELHEKCSLSKLINYQSYTMMLNSRAHSTRTHMLFAINRWHAFHVECNKIMWLNWTSYPICPIINVNLLLSATGHGMLLCSYTTSSNQ